jgi:hypothetical protein
MAELICQLHWDPNAKEVVKTYRVLSTGPNDKIKFTTADSEPFIIQADDAQLAKDLGLDEAPNANEPDLYQVPPPEAVQPHRPPGHLAAWLLLQCGTLDKDGKFITWGGVGPDGP